MPNTKIKNNNLGVLTDDAVLEIVNHKQRETVLLGGLDCNWSAANDSKEDDFFKAWAVVNFYEKSDNVFLHGARFGNWNYEYKMDFVKAVGSTGLYLLSLKNQNEFPNEFVIRLNRASGETFYDNNNYRNFYVEHGKGRLSTGIASGESVFAFDVITMFKVI